MSSWSYLNLVSHPSKTRFQLKTDKPSVNETGTFTIYLKLQPSLATQISSSDYDDIVPWQIWHLLHKIGCRVQLRKKIWQSLHQIGLLMSTTTQNANVQNLCVPYERTSSKLVGSFATTMFWLRHWVHDKNYPTSLLLKKITTTTLK